MPPPAVGFLLWTLTNLAVAGFLAWRLSEVFPASQKPGVILIFLGSYPVVLTLLVGQPQILLAWVFAECYRSLRRESDFQAGLWLGCLFLKPHYGVLLGLLLLWKRRWTAVAGAAVAGMIIVIGSILAAGLPAVLSYPDSLSHMAGFRGDYPSVMVNWRSLILDLRPDISDRRGVFLSLVLGLATVTCVAWAWRGRWTPQGPFSPPT